MAAAITITYHAPRFGEVRTRGTLNLGVYASTGIAVTANNFKLGDPNFELRLFPTTTGHIPSYDKANKKIKSYTQGVTTGATAAGALANGALALNDAGAEGVTRVSTTAASTVYKLGPLLEVANAVDLSAVVFAFEAIGAY